MADDSAAHSGATSDDGDPVETGRMSIGDHLVELRSCIVRALVGVVLCSVVGFVYGKSILGIICKPLMVVQFNNGLQPGAQVLSPQTAFIVYLKIAFLSGLILAGPWVLYQIWRFVASGLYGKEQRFLKALFPGAIGLFVVGVAFLYFIVLPIVLTFFIRFNEQFDLPSLAPSAFQRRLLPDETERRWTRTKWKRWPCPCSLRIRKSRHQGGLGSTPRRGGWCSVRPTDCYPVPWRSGRRRPR